MPFVLMRFRGVDLATWRQAFRDDRIVRVALGGKAETVLHNTHVPEDVWVLIEWDDRYRAQLFAQSDDLLDFLERSGSDAQLELWLLEQLATLPDAPPLHEGGPADPIMRSSPADTPFDREP